MKKLMKEVLGARERAESEGRQNTAGEEVIEDDPEIVYLAARAFGKTNTQGVGALENTGGKAGLSKKKSGIKLFGEEVSPEVYHLWEWLRETEYSRPTTSFKLLYGKTIAEGFYEYTGEETREKRESDSSKIIKLLYELWDKGLIDVQDIPGEENFITTITAKTITRGK